MAFGPRHCANCGSTVSVVEHVLRASPPPSLTVWLCSNCRDGAEDTWPSNQPDQERQRGGAWALNLVLRYKKLLFKLDEVRTATGQPWLKKTGTVLAFVDFLSTDTALDGSFPQMALELLPPLSAQIYGNLIVGMIAAAVAALRSADLKNPRIEEWLTGEIERRTLDFTAEKAMRWFYDCNSGAAGRYTLMAFRSFCPSPSQSLTEAEAEKQAADILDTVVMMKAGPLTRTPRRRG